MDISQGFDIQRGNMICRLLKSLYGLTQSSRQWNLKLTSALTYNGYSQSKFDYSMFSRTEGNDIVVQLVYVDGLLISSSSTKHIEELKFFLKQTFKMKDLCGLQYCLGIEISRNNQGITLNHHKYTLKLITETGLAGTRPSKTPMEMNSKLTSVEFDSFLGNNKSDWLLDNPTSYKRLIGKLLYLTVTRPNISFSFQQLRQFMHKPKESHMSVVFRVVK